MADIILGLILMITFIGFCSFIGSAIGHGIESAFDDDRYFPKSPFDYGIGADAWGALIGFVISIIILVQLF